MKTKNRDDVSAAQAKLDIFYEDEKKVVNKIKENAVEALLQTIYVGVGHLDGKRVIIPASDWAGEIDWEKETLTLPNRIYTRLRTIETEDLTEDQRSRIKEALHGSAEAPARRKSGTAGRPTSMDLVVEKLKDRIKNQKTEDTLSAEVEYLSLWLKSEHPHEIQLSPKAIANKNRDLFRTRKEKRV